MVREPIGRGAATMGLIRLVLALIRLILALCVILFGLLCGLMAPFAYKADDRSGTVLLVCLTLASLLIGSRLLRRRPRSWRDDPATEKQKSFAESLGIEYPRHISKGELSDLISEVTGR
jgi:hypothetical protein